MKNRFAWFAIGAAAASVFWLMVISQGGWQIFEAIYR